MADRIVPVAYVTRWAATAGILIVRDAEAVDYGYLSKARGGMRIFLSRRDWTEDKAEEEARYRSKIDAARKSAERKVKKLEALYSAPCKYWEV